MTDRQREIEEQSVVTQGTFVGREAEQERWRELMREILSSKKGLIGTLLGSGGAKPASIETKIKSRVVLIGGAAGIGKSRMSLKFRDIVVRERMFKGKFRPTLLDWSEAAERNPRLAILPPEVTPSPELALDVFYNHFVRDDFELAFEDYRAAVKETQKLASTVQGDELKAVWEFRARAMGQGLYRAAQEEKPLIFIIENYPKIAALGWLLRCMMEEAGSAVTWVLVGATDETEWTNEIAASRFINFQLAQMNDNELAEFLAAEISRYADAMLEDEGGELVTAPKPNYRSDEQIAHLRQVSGGLPLAARLEAYLLQVGLTVEELPLNSEPIRTLLLEIMEESLGRNHPDRLKVYAIALLRRPENGLLSAMLSLRADYLPVQDLLGQMRSRYAFLFEPGLNFHLHSTILPVLRDWMYEPTRRTDETGVLRLINRANTYLTERLREWGQSFINLKSKISDVKWSDWALDLAWFHFWMNEEEGWREVTPLLIAGAVYKPIVAEQALAMLADFARAGFFQKASLDRLNNLQGLTQKQPSAWQEIQKLGQRYNWFDGRWPQYADEFEILTEEQGRR